MHQKVAGSIPGRGAYGRQPIDVSQIDVLFPSPFLSLKSINIQLGEAFF